MFAVALCGLFAMACDSAQMQQMQEQLSRHEAEIQQLKSFVQSANADVSALQTTLQQIRQGGCVTGVKPEIQYGVTVGYTLVFASGQTAYIGNTGYQAPQMGVEQGEDGNYYWKVDGQWLKRPNGTLVQAGAETPSPSLGNENGKWFVTFEDGSTMPLNEKATSSAQLFKSVDTSNANYVLITLADGTILQLTTWSAHVALKNLVNQLNNNLYSLRTIVEAQQENDYLQSVTPFNENGHHAGWVMNFAKSGSVLVYSLEQELGGQGRKVKMENGGWWISEDGGETYVQVDQSELDVENYIVNIDVANPGYVQLALSDGTVLDIPRMAETGLELGLPSRELSLSLNESWTIPYTITGMNPQDAVITCFSDGNFVVSVSDNVGGKGTITIECIRVFSQGSVSVIVNEPNGSSLVKVIKLSYSAPTVPDIPPVPDTGDNPEPGSDPEPEFWRETDVVEISAEGGQAKVGIISMYGYVLTLGTGDWVKVTANQTSRGHYDLIFDVSPNPTCDDRYYTIYMTNVGSIRVHQAGNPNVPANPYWMCDYITLPPEGGEFPFKVKSTVKEIHFSHDPWLSIHFDDHYEEGDLMGVTFSAEPYNGLTDRVIRVPVDCGDSRGIIVVTQLAPLR